MIRPDLLEAAVDGVACEFRAVAVAAQVAEVELLQLSGNDLLGNVGGGIVGEMAVAAEDALLEAPWAARVVLEQFHVVVGFEDQHVGATHALDDELGRVAEIGEETDVSVMRAEEKANGILRVVRNGECVHAHVADLEARAGLEEAELEACIWEISGDLIARETVAVDRQAELGRKRAEALDVIAVFVRDQDTGERLGRALDAGEALANLTPAEPGVDEQAGVPRFEVGAIAGRPAAEDREMSGHWR